MLPEAQIQRVLETDSNFYIKTNNSDIILLVIYVDDLIITWSLTSLIQGIK